ncbi:phosphotransferase [Streptococcus cameli]
MKTMQLPKQFPKEIQSYLTKTDWIDCSGHSGATVLNLQNGYYLKVDHHGKLKEEAALTKYFSDNKLSAPFVTYFSQDPFDYLITKEGKGSPAHLLLDHPKQVCQTIANCLKELHKQKPDKDQISNRLPSYHNTALKNYEKGNFYQQALLPRFKIQSKEEAYNLITNPPCHLDANDFIHGDACLPNILLKDASQFSSFIDLGLAGYSDRHIDLYWVIWSLNFNLGNDDYGDYFLDCYGREEIDVEKLRLVAAYEAFG